MTKAKLRWKAIRPEEWRKIPEKRRLKRTVRGADIEGHYYLDIYDSETGKRRYEFPGLHTSTDPRRNDDQEALAKEFAAQFQDMKWRETHGYPTEASVRFLDYFRSLVTGRHPAWLGALRLLEAFPLRETPLTQINYEWLSQVQSYLLAAQTRSKRTLSQNSASTYYAKIKAALAIAVQKDLITQNPASKIKAIPQVPSQREYLTHEEMQKLANTPCNEPIVKRAFLFSCYTGLRLSDVQALTWDRIRNGRLEIRLKKPNEPEYMDLSDTAKALLGPRVDSNELVFQLPPDGTTWTHLQVWGATAGISKHLSFHVSRHSFATSMLEHTKDIYLVSKLLGHSDIKHTQIYAKIVDSRKREALLTLPAIELS